MFQFAILSHFLLAGFLLTAAPTIGYSQQQTDACPQSLEEGQTITLERSKSSFLSRFTKKDGKLWEEREQKKLGRKELIQSAFLHALLPESRKVSGRKLEIEFDEPAKLIKELPYQKLWLSEMTLKMNGQLVAQGVERLEYRGKKLINIGKCHYMTWVVRTITDVKGRDPIYFMKYYSPDLGLVLKSYKVNAKDSILSGVEFDRISLRGK